MLTLQQTHIWPGTVGRTAGRLVSRFARRIPGGAAVGGVLDVAGNIAGAAGAVEAAGPVIVLKYEAGPPARLSYVRSANERTINERSTNEKNTNERSTTIVAASSDRKTSGTHSLVAENGFDLDGFNVFAISLNGGIFQMGGNFDGNIGWNTGMTITLFEGYKANTFFTPSYFLSGKYGFLDLGEGPGDSFAFGAGVLFKHRFPKNRVLWNLGASLELMWVSALYDGNTAALFGAGVQTGFSFRFDPYTSLGLNGLAKFPFDTVKGDRYLDSKSVWPFSADIELTLTSWLQYRSKQ